MRFGLIDLLFAIASIAIGAVLGRLLVTELPAQLQPIAGTLGGICIYLALIYPFYRGLKLFPMVLPRCPCCGSFQRGFHVLGIVWPRINFRCPTGNGDFVIWHNGKPGAQETWEKPVLVLKWPYAFGIYHRIQKPKPDAGLSGISAAPLKNPSATEGPPPVD